MLHLRITTPAGLSADVVRVLRDDPAISSLSVVPGASVKPRGDLVLADVPREAANEVLDQLRDIGVHREGTIHVEPVRTWISESGFRAERRTPGSSAAIRSWDAEDSPAAETIS